MQTCLLKKPFLSYTLLLEDLICLKATMQGLTLLILGVIVGHAAALSCGLEVSRDCPAVKVSRVLGRPLHKSTINSLICMKSLAKDDSTDVQCFLLNMLVKIEYQKH